MNASTSMNLIGDSEAQLTSKIASFIDDPELRSVVLFSIIGLLSTGLVILIVGLRGVTPAWD